MPPRGDRRRLRAAAELGAVDDANALTPIGRELARLPLDPRVGRMILEARNREALDEVLVIAGAHRQDVRDRPLEAQQAADEKHRKFDDEKSEFMGYLKLWKWIDEGAGSARSCDTKTAVRSLSNRQQEQRLRESFVSPRRVREWRDIHSQLHTVVAEHGWRLNTLPASYEQMHVALLAGLLGNMGCKSDDEEGTWGARRPVLAPPGAHLEQEARALARRRRAGRDDAFVRPRPAAIEPQWIVGLAGHLLQRQLLEPHWEKKAAEVVALERATPLRPRDPQQQAA